LTARGDLPGSFLNRVAIALDDLNLPYTFDVSLLEQIDNDNLRDHIERVGIECYEAEDKN